MALSPRLWSASLTAKPQHIDLFADALDCDALSLSTLAKPRSKTATAEALYKEKPGGAALTARLAIAATVAKTRAPKLIIKQMPPLDWLEKVAQDFPPLPIANWVIYGTQHKDAIADPRRALEINASSAFGTGEHPTTRGCLMLLAQHLKKSAPRNMLDMGCGSGILAMAAVKGRACRAIGIDLDPPSVTLAKENIARNGLQQKMRAALGNGYRANLVSAHGPYDLIMANIFAKPLAHMAKDLRKHLKPGGTAILAGLLTHQANMVLAAHRAEGLYLKRRLVIGEWTILALQRPSKA
jgi:ribosomal protein L11 methyltransferase